MEYKKKYDKIIEICKKYNVKSLKLFGSILTENFDDDSDVDFLIEFSDPQNGLNRYMNVKFELEELFSRPVDLVMPNSIKNERIKNYIFSNVREVYAT